MDTSVGIVTGASKGIGKATAIRLARDFSAIALVARTETTLEETASAVKAAGGESLVIAADLSQPSAAETVVTSTQDRFGRIDALVNIAGAVPGVDLFSLTDQQWEDGAALKLHGARRLTICAWDALKASRGSVVFMAGKIACEPKAANAAVGVINAAIIALAKAFAEQGVRDGVQVNSISPGWVLTERLRGFMGNVAKAHNVTIDEAIKLFPKEAGVERLGQPEEIADLVAYFISPQAKWLTGSSIRIDGGETKGI